MKTTLAALIGLGALAVLWPISSRAQTPSTTPSATDRVTITGWALNMSNTATGANQNIRINIDRWSNPSQRQHLIGTFMEKKQDGLLRELEKQPELGRFNFPGYMGPDPNNTMRLGTDIRYAMSFSARERRPAHRRHHAAHHRLPRGSQPAADLRLPVLAVPDALRQGRQGRRPDGVRDPAHVRQEDQLDRDRELLERAGTAEQPGARSQKVEKGLVVTSLRPEQPRHLDDQGTRRQLRPALAERAGVPVFRVHDE